MCPSARSRVTRTARDFPIIPCNLCGSQENLQRVAIKKMLADWEREHPGRTESLLTALRNVEPAHLADTSCSISPASIRLVPMKPPLPHSYWVEPGRLLAGEHPDGGDASAHARAPGNAGARRACAISST